MCVAHRQRFKNMLSLPAAGIGEHNGDQIMDKTSTNQDTDHFEEIILYQMTVAKVSKIFTAKVIQLTVVEDSMFASGYVETIVADTTGDVIKLQLDLGVDRPEYGKELLRKYRFGTVWKLPNPDFRMKNGDESTMYIRYDRRNIDLRVHSMHCIGWRFSVKSTGGKI